MAEAMQTLLNEAMKCERTEFLGAGHYERNEGRQGYANGYKQKRVKTRIGELDLAVPKVRGLEEGSESFYPRSLERGVRSERALKLAIAEMYVQGVSTRKVVEVTRQLCGLDVSSTQVSRATKQLDEELQAWRDRPLGAVPLLVLDARYEKVRHGGTVVDSSVLVAVGVLPSGHRTVLGLSVSLSEAEVHWRAFLESLQERGLHGVEMVTSDSHAGLKAALKARMPGVPWQRCQFHLQQNATAYVPRVAQRKAVARDIKSVFDAPNEAEAMRLLELIVKKWQPKAPKLAAWMEENIPQGLTVFQLPPEQRRRMRTSNMLERLNKEIRRRTRVATLFPNDDSLLRLVSAVLIEVSEEWETGRKYLSMEKEDSPQ
ncbi:MAG: IS256 family transposase [Dehalococcoidia bacterium]